MKGLLGVWLPATAVVVAAILTGIYGPALRERTLSKKELAEKNAKQTSDLAVITERRVEALLTRYNADIDDLRTRLHQAEQEISNLRVQLAQWESGMKAALGYVILPETLVQYIRERAPDLLPATRFPGERVVGPTPGNTGDPDAS